MSTRTANNYVAFLEGIRVPLVTVGMEWSAKGFCGFNIILPGTPEYGDIPPGTRVDIFYVDNEEHSFHRNVIEVDAPAAESGPLFSALSVPMADACRQTIGSSFLPDIPRDEHLGLEDVTRLHGLKFRVGGYTVGSAESLSNSGRGHQYSCRGVERAYERLQLIQLSGGHGTLADEERRFFGQDPTREGGPALELLASSGSRAFANAVVDILLSEDEFARGIRKLMTQYATEINDFWTHRLTHHRVMNRLAIVEGDQSVTRLLGTNAFRRYLRDKLQQSYVAPMREAIDSILAFIGYRMVALPSPPFFPLVPAQEPVYEDVTTTSSTLIPRGGDAVVEWPRTAQINESDVPTGPNFRGDLIEAYEGEGVFDYGNIGLKEYFTTTEWRGEAYTPVFFDFEWQPFKTDVTVFVINPGTARAVVTEDQKLVKWSYEPLYSSTLTEEWGVTTDTAYVTPTISKVETPTGKFEWGQRYSFLYEQTGSFASGPMAGESLDYPFRVNVRMGAAPINEAVDTTTVSQVEIPPPPIEDYRDDRALRLHDLAIVPHLWWACPPTCNVLLPEVIAEVRIQDAGAEKTTRLLGKIAPGRSGSRRTFVDKFSAPNTGDLNAALQADDNDEQNPSILRRNEYVDGPVVEMHYFDALHRLVRTDDWERYIRSFITHKYWDRRLGARTATVALASNETAVVPGFPILVVAPGSEEIVDGLTQEQVDLLERLRELRRLLRQLQACLNRYLGLRQALNALVTYLEFLARLAAALYGTNSNFSGGGLLYAQVLDSSRPIGETLSSSPERLEESRVADAVNRYFVRRGSSAFDVRVNALAVALSQNNLYDSPAVNALPEAIRSNAIYFAGADSDVFEYEEVITTYLGEEAAYAITPAAGTINKLPQVDTLIGWIRQAREAAGGFDGCIAALRADIALVEEAIDEAVSDLRNLGVAAGNTNSKSFIGYVESVSEEGTADGSRIVAQVTHVRYVGENLDDDDLAGDSVENAVAFGQDGYLDDIYSVGRIGNDVYLPTLGCESIADLPLVQESIDEGEGLTGEADISDVTDALTHQDVCGHSCLDEAQDQLAVDLGLTTERAAMAIIDEYRRLKSIGTEDQALLKWLRDLTARPMMTVSDAYRGMPLLYSPEEDPVVVEDLNADDVAVYGDDMPARGFFSKVTLRHTEQDKFAELYYQDELPEDHRAELDRRSEKVLAAVDSYKAGLVTRD